MDIDEKVEIVKKKDFKPIWLYIVLQLLIPFAMGILVGIFGKNMDEEVLLKKIELLSFLLTNIITFFVFLLIFWNKIITGIKKLNKKYVIITVITAAFVVIINRILFMVCEKLKIPMDNQDMVMGFFNEFPLLIGIVTGVLGPYIEEIVFRYSLGTIIKNNTLFVIISSIIFGIFHGIGIATIIYILIGIAFALIYLKTDKNIIYPVIAHIINNVAVSIITILFS